MEVAAVSGDPPDAALSGSDCLFIASDHQPGGEADRLVPALTDPDLLEIAWTQHGLRGPLGRIGRGGPLVSGIAESIRSITPMPDANIMLTLLERLSRMRNDGPPT